MDSTRRRFLEGVAGTGSFGVAGCLRLAQGKDNTATTNSNVSRTDPKTTSSTSSDAGLSEPFTEGFDRSAFGERWNDNSGFLQLTSEVATSGNRSLQADSICGFNCHPDPLASIRPNELSGDQRPSSVTFYWREGESSYGAALAVYNDDGKLMAGAATNNPEWDVWSDAREREYPTTNGWGIQLYDGDGYDRWIRTTMNFDWVAGTVEYRYTDLESGSNASRIVELPEHRQMDVAELRLHSYSNNASVSPTESEPESYNQPLGDNASIANGSINHYWDEIEVV